MMIQSIPLSPAHRPPSLPRRSTVLTLNPTARVHRPPVLSTAFPLFSFFFLLFSLLILGRFVSPAWAGSQTPEKEMSDTVEVLCPKLAGMKELLGPAQSDLLVRCGEVKIKVDNGQTFQELSDEQIFALTQMTADETSAMGTITVEISGVQVAVISGRLAAIRGGASGGLALNMERKSPFDDLPVLFAGPGAPPAVDESEFTQRIGDTGRLGVFFNSSFTTGDRDETRIEPGFDFDGWSVTGGADYRLTNSLVLGGAVGYAATETDLDGGIGDVEADGYSLSLYGTYWVKNFYVDAIGTYADKSYETVRHIDYAVAIPVRQTLLGDSDAEEWSFSLGGGYEMAKGGWTYGPFARLNYLDSQIDGYDERLADFDSTAPGFGIAMRVDDQEIESLTTVVGGQASYAFSTNMGILSPHMRLGWVHEFENDGEAMTAHFLNVPDDPEILSLNTIRIPVEEPDEDYFNLALGVSAVFPRGILAFLDYETALALEDISLHQFTGGLRFEF